MEIIVLNVRSSSSSFCSLLHSLHCFFYRDKTHKIFF